RSTSAGGPGEYSGLLARVRVATTELLHATGGVEDLLLAGVERVRGGGDVDVDHRVGVAVLPLDRVRGGDGRLRQDREVRRDVTEHNRLVVRVDVLLHINFLQSGVHVGGAPTGGCLGARCSSGPLGGGARAQLSHAEPGRSYSRRAARCIS